MHEDRDRRGYNPGQAYVGRDGAKLHDGRIRHIAVRAYESVRNNEGTGAETGRLGKISQKSLANIVDR